MSNNLSSPFNLYYTAEEAKQLLRKLPYLLAVITTPKSSSKTIGLRDYKVYEVRHSTYILDLLADVSAVWNSLPSFFRSILTGYYLLGYTDIDIGNKMDMHPKSVFRVRQLAVKAVVKALSEGNHQPLEKLKKFQRKPRITRRIITRVWRAPEEA